MKCRKKVVRRCIDSLYLCPTCAAKLLVSCFSTFFAVAQDNPFCLQRHAPSRRRRAQNNDVMKPHRKGSQMLLRWNGPPCDLGNRSIPAICKQFARHWVFANVMLHVMFEYGSQDRKISFYRGAESTEFSFMCLLFQLAKVFFSV